MHRRKHSIINIFADCIFKKKMFFFISNIAQVLVTSVHYENDNNDF